MHDKLASGFDGAAALELLAMAGDEQRILVVGHNPDFGQVVHDLTGANAEVKKGGSIHLTIKPTDLKLLRYCVKKGSITVDGISLTIHDLTQETLRFQIIPHTWTETDLPDLKTRDLVNIEVDILAKYIERFEQHDKETQARN